MSARGERKVTSVTRDPDNEIARKLGTQAHSHTHTRERVRSKVCSTSTDQTDN